MTISYAAEVCPLPIRHWVTSYVNLCWFLGGFVSAGVLKYESIGGCAANVADDCTGVYSIEATSGGELFSTLNHHLCMVF